MENIREKAASLRRAVAYGLENGKRNLIVDLDVLNEIFLGNVPVGGNELPPEDVTALLYEAKKRLTKYRHAATEARAALYGCREVLGDVANIQHAIDLLRAAMEPDEAKREQSYDDLAASGGIVDAP